MSDVAPDGRPDQPAKRSAPEAVNDGFFPIHLAAMQPGTVTPVDLYLRLEGRDRYVLYKGAQTPLTEGIRDRLVTNGVERLYLRNEDEEAFQRYLEDQICAIAEDDLMPPEQLWPVVYEACTGVMRNLFENPRSGENIRRAAKVGESVVISLLKRRAPLREFTSMMSHDYYTYTHCVNLCIFLVAASMEVLDVESRGDLLKIGTGGILHDIGKSQIPKEILSKGGELTEAEYEQIKQHPIMGLQILEEHMKLSDVTAAIVRSHHERFDGKGYPDGLAGEQITPMVRLSTVVDVYDALTTNRPYAEALSPFEALQMMLKQMRGHFETGMLRSFIKFLGPSDLTPKARSWRASTAH